MYGKCFPATLDDFASECVLYDVNICKGKTVIFFFFISKCVDCGLVSTGQLLGPNGYLTYKEFKTKFQTVQ